MRWDDGEEMERENEGGWKEWIGEDGEGEGKGMERILVDWWVVNTGN